MAASDSPLSALQTRLADAERLIEIHEEATGREAGRRHGYDALNRSAVMLSVAAWEGFNEDLLRSAVINVARRLSGPSDLPENVRDAMLVTLHAEGTWSSINNKSKRTIWAITGEGWRATYIRYAGSKIRGLNTPNFENLKKLYASTVGLDDFTEFWGAKRWPRDIYVNRLSEALALRHRIAHGAIGDEAVRKSRAEKAVGLVNRLAGWTANAVDAHIFDIASRRKIDLTHHMREAIADLRRSS